jgi:hypothetical protein
LLDDKLYSDGYDSEFSGFSNTISVTVNKVTPWWQPDVNIQTDNLMNRSVDSAKKFQVDTQMEFKLNMFRDNGPNTWFITVVKESPDAPWLIDGVGSGP